MISSVRHWWASVRLLCCEFAIALYEQAPPLSPAFAQVPELKSRRRELLAHLRAIEDEQE
jgi:hypothetical protein